MIFIDKRFCLRGYLPFATHDFLKTTYSVETKNMSLLILYGTETGTAQDVSESIRRDSQLRGIPSQVVSFDDYDIEVFVTKKMEIPTLQRLCEENVVVFVVSTTGQGEIPPNMQPAWRWLLRKAIPKNWLSQVRMFIKSGKMFSGKMCSVLFGRFFLYQIQSSRYQTL